MQDFYGDDPFVLNKTIERTRKSGEKVNVGVNKRAIAIILIVSLSVIFALSFFVFEKEYTITVPEKNYYAVCFYSGQTKSEAESVSAGLIRGGGSGYIVNNGTYNVYGGVYKDKASADSVSEKQTESTRVVRFGWQQLKINVLTERESKLCGEALTYFSGVTDNLVTMSVNLDTFIENDATVELYLNNAAANFEKYAKNITTPQISKFFENCVFSIENNVLKSEEGLFNSRLKYVTQDLIMLRINLDTTGL